MLSQLVILHIVACFLVLMDDRKTSSYGVIDKSIRILEKHYSHFYTNPQKIKHLANSVIYLTALFTDIDTLQFLIYVFMFAYLTIFTAQGVGYSDRITHDKNSFQTRLNECKETMLYDGGIFLKFLEYHTIPYLVLFAIIPIEVRETSLHIWESLYWYIKRIRAMLFK